MVTTASAHNNHPSQRITTQSQEDVSWTDFFDPISHPMGQGHQTESKGNSLWDFLMYCVSYNQLSAFSVWNVPLIFSSVYFRKHPHVSSTISLLIQVGKEWICTSIYMQSFIWRVKNLAGRLKDSQS